MKAPFRRGRFQKNFGGCAGRAMMPDFKHVAIRHAIFSQEASLPLSFQIAHKQHCKVILARCPGERQHQGIIVLSPEHHSAFG
mgnify:CR=1 FL=1